MSGQLNSTFLGLYPCHSFDSQKLPLVLVFALEPMEPYKGQNSGPHFLVHLVPQNPG